MCCSDAMLILLLKLKPSFKIGIRRAQYSIEKPEAYLWLF